MISREMQKRAMSEDQIRLEAQTLKNYVVMGEMPGDEAQVRAKDFLDAWIEFCLLDISSDESREEVIKQIKKEWEDLKQYRKQVTPKEITLGTPDEPVTYTIREI